MPNFNTHFVSDIGAPTLFTSQFIAEIDTPTLFTSQFIAEIDTPTIFSSQFIADIERYTAFNISLILTGDADGLLDYEYRLKSFNITRYSGSQSSFNFQMPKQPDAIEAWNARPNGELIVYRLTDEIFRCNPQYYNYNVGASSQTMGITGTKQTTYTDFKTVNVDGRVTNIKTSVQGTRTFTVADYLDIDPLDSITYKSETIQIKKITVNVSISGFSYGLTEV